MCVFCVFSPRSSSPQCPVPADTTVCPRYRGGGGAAAAAALCSSRLVDALGPGAKLALVIGLGAGELEAAGKTENQVRPGTIFLEENLY